MHQQPSARNQVGDGQRNAVSRASLIAGLGELENYRGMRPHGLGGIRIT